MNHAQNTKTVMVIAPVAKTNSSTASATFDVMGADYCTLVIAMSSELNTNAVGPAITLSEGAAATGSWSTFTAARAAEDLTAARHVRYDFDTRTLKRYIKVAVNPDTTTNDNVTVSAIAILSRLEQTPDTTTEMVGSTNDVAVIV